MPYVEKADRLRIDELGPSRDKGGEVNYQITNWLQRRHPPSLFRHNMMKLFQTLWAPAPSYEIANRFYGATVLALREYGRRMGEPSPLMETAFQVLDAVYTDYVAPYEDEKIKTNGDLEYYELAAKMKERQK